MGGRSSPVKTAAPLPEVFHPVLRRLETDAASHYRVSVRLVPTGSHERPFSHIVRLAVSSRESDAVVAHLFAKVLKPKPIEGGINAMQERIRRDFEATRRAAVRLSGHRDLGVVPAIACYPELLAIVTEEVAGPTLLEYLEKEAAWFPGTDRIRACERVLATAGRWVRAFQDTDEQPGGVAVDDLRTYIDHRLRQLVAHGGTEFDETARQRVLTHIDDLGALIAPAMLRAVPIHADLALGNVLVSGSRIVVLDFAMAQTGTRLHDLTRLFVQLDLLTAKPQFRTSVVRRLQHALVDGYDPGLTVSDPLFRLLVLLHRINHLATLTLSPATSLRGLYHSRLRRLHRQWIEGDMATTGHAVPAA